MSGVGGGDAPEPDPGPCWYVCVDCNRAFIDLKLLRAHKWNQHKSKGLNVLILSQSIDLAPVLKIKRCVTAARNTRTPCDPDLESQGGVLTTNLAPVSLTSGDSDYDSRNEGQEQGEESGSDNDWKVEDPTQIKTETDSATSYHESAKQIKCNICGKPVASIWKLRVHKLSHQALNISCPECGKLLKSENHLRTHLRETHPQVRRYKCEKCDATFTSSSHLKGHQARHTEERPFACPECPNAKFKLKHTLRVHIRVSHRRPYSCRVCQQVFTGRLPRNTHEVDVHQFRRGRRQILKCEHEGCGKVFKNGSGLKRHQSLHWDRRDFICAECGKGFKTKKVLHKHQYTHVPLDKRQFGCDVGGCGMRFAIPSSLNKHKRQVHFRRHLDGSREEGQPEDSGSKQIECDICGKPFPSGTDLKSHKLSHQAPNVLCPECGKLLKSDLHLRAHLRGTHPKVRRYKCEKCDASFKSKAHLKGHQARHTEERPFACTECPDKKFKVKKALRVHTAAFHRPHSCRECGKDFAGQLLRDRHEFEVHEFKRREDKQIFNCAHEGCGKTFTVASHYKRHQLVHSDERNFTCATCGKSFKTQKVLNIHLHTHVPLEERPFACDALNCGLRFKILSSLSKHKKQVHAASGRVKPVYPPSPCRVCGLEFSKKVNAVTHELRVHDFQRGDGEFAECGTCCKRFPYPSLLREHELSHVDVRDNVCETCGKEFKRKSALNRHRMRHVPYEELLHLCDVCGKRFGWVGQVRKHKQRVHGVGAKSRKEDSEIDEEESESEDENTD